MAPLTLCPSPTRPRSYAGSAPDLASALLQSGLVAFALVDSGHVVAASPALRELLGGPSASPHIDGKSLASLAAESERDALASFWRGLLHEGARAQLRCRLLRPDGTAVPVLLQGASVAVEGSYQVMLVATDLGPWVGAVAAGGAVPVFEPHDPVTGFVTRRLLQDRIDAALATARRYRRRSAILRFDLESLDRWMRSLAPAASLQLQSDLACALRRRVRECDTIARLTAHEFVALLPEVETRDDAGIMAARLVESVLRCSERDGSPRVTATVGVAVFPNDGISPDSLLSAAEAAMESARGSRAGRFAFAQGTGTPWESIEPLEFLDEHRRGVPEIDDAHGALVRQINRLVAQWLAGEAPAALEHGLHETVALLRAHLAAEAGHRGGSGADAARHGGGRGVLAYGQANQRFLEELDSILLDVNSQSVSLALRHLCDWLRPHLLRADDSDWLRTGAAGKLMTRA